MKTMHPADAADRAAIATATGFITSIFLGTGQFAKVEAETVEFAAVDFSTMKGLGGWVFVISRPEPASAHVPAAAAKAKSPKKISKPKDVKPAGGKRAAIQAAAEVGKMPTPPDFSATTHARFRNKLDEVVKLAKAGDLKGLKATKVNPSAPARRRSSVIACSPSPRLRPGDAVMTRARLSLRRGRRRVLEVWFDTAKAG